MKGRGVDLLKEYQEYKRLKEEEGKMKKNKSSKQSIKKSIIKNNPDLNEKYQPQESQQIQNINTIKQDDIASNDSYISKREEELQKQQQKVEDLRKLVQLLETKKRKYKNKLYKSRDQFKENMETVISKAFDATEDVQTLSNKYSKSLKILRRQVNLNDTTWKNMEDNAFLHELAKNGYSDPKLVRQQEKRKKEGIVFEQDNKFKQIQVQKGDTASQFLNMPSAGQYRQALRDQENQDKYSDSSSNSKESYYDDDKENQRNLHNYSALNRTKSQSTNMSKLSNCSNIMVQNDYSYKNDINKSIKQIKKQKEVPQQKLKTIQGIQNIRKQFDSICKSFKQFDIQQNLNINECSNLTVEEKESFIESKQKENPNNKHSFNYQQQFAFSPQEVYKNEQKYSSMLNLNKNNYNNQVKIKNFLSQNSQEMSPSPPYILQPQVKSLQGLQHTSQDDPYSSDEDTLELARQALLNNKQNKIKQLRNSIQQKNLSGSQFKVDTQRQSIPEPQPQQQQFNQHNQNLNNKRQCHNRQIQDVNTSTQSLNQEKFKYNGGVQRQNSIPQTSNLNIQTAESQKTPIKDIDSGSLDISNTFEISQTQIQQSDNKTIQFTTENPSQNWDMIYNKNLSHFQSGEENQETSSRTNPYRRVTDRNIGSGTTQATVRFSEVNKKHVYGDDYEGNQGIIQNNEDLQMGELKNQEKNFCNERLQMIENLQKLDGKVKAENKNFNQQQNEQFSKQDFIQKKLNNLSHSQQQNLMKQLQQQAQIGDDQQQRENNKNTGSYKQQGINNNIIIQNQQYKQNDMHRHDSSDSLKYGESLFRVVDQINEDQYLLQESEAKIQVPQPIQQSQQKHYVGNNKNRNQRIQQQINEDLNNKQGITKNNYIKQNEDDAYELV